VSKDKAGEQVLNEVPPPVPSVPISATGVATGTATTVSDVVPTAPAVPVHAAPAPAPTQVLASVPAATETTRRPWLRRRLWLLNLLCRSFSRLKS
jgi:hypothetical protein